MVSSILTPRTMNKNMLKELKRLADKYSRTDPACMSHDSYEMRDKAFNELVHFVNEYAANRVRDALSSEI